MTVRIHDSITGPLTLITSLSLALPAAMLHTAAGAGRWADRFAGVGSRNRRGGRIRRFGSRGQTTAEYALVLIGVAALALLVLAWATNTGKVGELFDKVIDSVIDKVP